MFADLLAVDHRRDSPIRRLPAPVKLAAALGGLLATVLAPASAWTFFLVWAALLAAVALVGKVPGAFLLKRVALLEPLVLGVGALAWLQPHGGSVFVSLLLKSNLCLATMILLSATTPFADLLRVLQRLRIPALLLTTVALMHRYLFVLANEAERMKRARASRTFTAQRRHTWKSLGAVVAQLFVRTTERAERIYAAMCARGWR